MQSRPWMAGAFCALAYLSFAPAQSVVISEIMASNQDTIDDEDGESSDWLELFNTTVVPVDLDGWYLTDDPAALTKWELPGVTLAAGDFLLIFASNKDRRDPSAELHANFKLSSSGEYLALVRPDGTTVEHDYAPAFPSLVTDVSYGLGMSGSDELLITLGSPLKWRIPTNGSDDVGSGADPEWIDNDFPDGSWGSGTGGAGYANAEPDSYDPYIQTDLETQLSGQHPSLYLRFPFTPSSPGSVTSLTLRMRYDDGFAAYLNGEPVPAAASNAPVSPVWNSTATANHPDPDALIPTDFVIPDPSLLPGTNILAIHAMNTSSSSSDLLAQPELIAAGAAALDGEENYSVNPTPGSTNNLGGTPGPLVKNVTKDVAPIDVGGTGGITVVADSVAEFSGVQGQDGWTYGYHQGSGSYTGSFTQFPGGAGQGSWNGSSQLWTGSIWDVQTAATSPWTSVGASSVHPNDSNPGPRQATVRRWTSDVAGNYTIAGSFNNVNTGGDGTTGRIYHNGSQIFSAVTDGNSQSVSESVTLAIGDTIDFFVDVGPADTDGSDGTNTNFQIAEGSFGGTLINLPITADIAPTLNPLAGVTLKYRIKYGSEVDVTMVDDGTGDDAVAGDGTFTGTISTDQLAPGEMLRWRVVAQDNVGNSTVWPPFPEPLDSPEYCGTIAADPAVTTSLLPVMHWFTDNPGGANTRTPGARSSVFFEGQFYDNVLFDLHGQSTGGFPKKSYDVDFNTGDRFRWKAGEKRVKDINLLTNWADKAKVRNVMGYGLPTLTGEPAHFAVMVRVQQNGAFFNTADMVEDGDDRYLERVGLDGEGALYKMYNRLDSTGANTKKTRKDEGKSDLQALINGLGQSGDAKLRFGYDNVDIPGTVNYLCCLTLINNRDHGHKNYYMYRDTLGTREWRPLIWDVDLNLGRNWVGGPAYFDDSFTVNGLVNGASNRLKDLIYDYPELWTMYTRRMKTIVDTFVQPAGTPDPVIETMVDDLLALVDPPGVVSDADLDYTKWGSWGNQNNAAAGVARIKSEFMPSFRTHFYSTIAGSLPASQPAMAPVDIGMGEFNPTSGDQMEEYFTLSHSNSYPVDISGWRIDGGVRLDIPAGTVIPAGMTLYVGRDAVSFRGRATSPKANEKRFLISGYGGQLSARGETLELYDDAGNLIDTLAYTGAPTAMQQSLRITELNFHPADPTASELAIDPNWTASDFEFVELTNIGGATLDISGAQFVAGIEYTFPGGTTLAPGQSVLIVVNQAAFEARYGNGLNVAGQYLGQLDNGGEELQLLDDVGENVLEFTYDDAWYAATDGPGYSLEIRDSSADIADWDLAGAWAPSCLAGGSPGDTSGGHGMLFEIWKEDHYTAVEAADPLVSGATVDADGDLRTTMLEYALTSDPKAADGSGLITGVVDDGGDDYLALALRRPKHAVDLTYSVETGSDLVGWLPSMIVFGTPVDHGDGTETVIFRDTVKVGDAGSRRFIRAVVNLAE